jgi:hypothetical protein
MAVISERFPAQRKPFRLMAAIALSAADTITQALDYLRVGLAYTLELRGFRFCGLAFGGPLGDENHDGKSPPYSGRRG